MKGSLFSDETNADNCVGKKGDSKMLAGNACESSILSPSSSPLMPPLTPVFKVSLVPLNYILS